MLTSPRFLLKERLGLSSPRSWPSLSRSRSAWARSSPHRRRSATIWTGCPRESADGLSSPEALASWWATFLVCHGSRAKLFWGKVLDGERSWVWIQRSQWKHQILWVISREFIHTPNYVGLINKWWKPIQTQRFTWKPRKRKIMEREREVSLYCWWLQ